MIKLYNFFMNFFHYRIVLGDKARNVGWNLSNFILVFAYMLISMYNVMWETEPLLICSVGDYFSVPNIQTLFLIIINLIILARIYIKLKMQQKDMAEHTSEWLKEGERYNVEDNGLVSGISVEDNGIKTRLGLLGVAVLVSAIVLIFVGILGNPASDIIKVIIFLAVISTFLDDVIEILFHTYHIKTQFTIIRYVER